MLGWGVGKRECLRRVATRFASLGGIEGSSWCTYGVGFGGVEVGAHDAVFLDLGEEVFGVRVGECGRHLGGCVWG